MKKISIKLLAILLVLFWSCTQEVIELQPPAEETPTPITPSKGSADFSKFVSIGDALTAGFQAGALFTEGQQNSMPLILSKQFSLAQGTTLTFNQPDINSTYGYYGTERSLILGRLLLYDPDGPTGPKPTTPTPVGTLGMPAPYNAGGSFPTPYTGDKTKLNNFGVPGILLGQALTPDTGNPASPYYNGLWARFASAPGIKSILQDAIAAQPTFFLFDLGNNDVLGYAIGGASNSTIFTTEANFQAQYSAAINALLAASTASKGVIANIPDVTTIPYFFTVTYNAIPLDAATATAVNTAFAGYNQILDAIKATPSLLALVGATATEIDSRKVTFAASNTNRILLADEAAKDLGDAFDALVNAGQITAAQRTALEPYRKVRQATATDLITLSAGSVLGTKVGGNAQLVIGVTVPLEDKYALIPTETIEIKMRIAAFNTIIKNIADANPTRLALADVNGALTALATAKAQVYNGVTITPSFAPPTGAFSEDGVHPNSRGYAFMANIFIDAINAKFNAVIPKANLADYKGTGLPIYGQ